MVSDLEINIKDYDYKSDKPLATGSTADVYLINYDGHESREGFHPEDAQYRGEGEETEGVQTRGYNGRI
jgi:hypothetical protein